MSEELSPSEIEAPNSGFHTTHRDGAELGRRTADDVWQEEEPVNLAEGMEVVVPVETAL